MLTERESTAPRTCAYCRAELGGEAIATCVCGVALHRECLADNRGACTTVGCPGLPAAQGEGAAEAIAPGPAPLAPRAPSRWQATAALGALVLVAFAARLFAPVAESALAAELLLFLLAPLLTLVATRQRLVSPGTAARLVFGLAGLALFARDPRAHRDDWSQGFDLYLYGPALALLAAAATTQAARRLAPRGAQDGKEAAPRGVAILAGALLAGAALLGLIRGASESDPNVRTSWLRQHLTDLRWDLALNHGGREQVTQVVDRYTSRDDATRWAIVRASHRLDRADVTPLLVELLEAPDPYTRHAAAALLGANRSRLAAVVPALVARLVDPEPVVREAACGALRAWVRSHPEAVRPHAAALRAATRDPDPWVRMNAVHALGELRDLESIPLLIERLGDDDQGSPPIHPDNWDHVAAAAEKELIALGLPAAAAARTAALEHASPEVRAGAARVHQALVEAHGPAAGAPLAE